MNQIEKTKGGYLVSLVIVLLAIGMTNALEVSPATLTFTKDGECQVLLISGNHSETNIPIIIYGNDYSDQKNSADWFSVSHIKINQLSSIPTEVAVCLDKPCCLGDREYRASLMVGKFPVSLKVLPESSGLNYLWWAIGVVLLIAIIKHI